MEQAGNSEEIGLGTAINGAADNIASEFAALADLGFDHIEAVPFPSNPDAVHIIAEGVAKFRA